MPLIFGCLSLSLAFFPVFKADSRNAVLASTNNEVVISTTATVEEDKTASAEAAASSLYTDLNLQALGLNFDALKYAYKGYAHLKAKGALANSSILTVVDFSQSSRKKRMYIIDMDNREVLMNTYVAHGKNTGLDMATRFSNVQESLQSSLGFYVTKGTYFGKHGLSLRLDGQEPGYNSNALSRAVVVHGADYIGEHRKGAGYMGRSFGCPAVPKAQASKIINMIKDGTTMFIYHPSNSYLHGSRILNG